MQIITDTQALADYVASLAGQDFVTIDTEFLRESTYWPKLCLVQLASPGDDGVIVDPLAKGLDQQPLYDLLYDPSIVKVFTPRGRISKYLCMKLARCPIRCSIPRWPRWSWGSVSRSPTIRWCRNWPGSTSTNQAVSPTGPAAR